MMEKGMGEDAVGLGKKSACRLYTLAYFLPPP